MNTRGWLGHQLNEMQGIDGVTRAGGVQRHLPDRFQQTTTVQIQRQANRVSAAQIMVSYC